MREEAAAQWGRLDLLVNNAGNRRVVPHGDLQAATPDIWRELHEVNAIAPFRLVAEAVGGGVDGRRYRVAGLVRTARRSPRRKPPPPMCRIAIKNIAASDCW